MKFLISISLFISLISFSCNSNGLSSKKTSAEDVVHSIINKTPYLIIGEKNFLTGYKPLDIDGNINVVIEIPTGTIDKWEVDKKSGNMTWEFRNGSPRKVNYLGYPGNYGMIPQTLLPKSLGGDGDPLDVIVLGPSVKRGSVIKAKLIGALKLLDDGEQDDKLVAVMEGTPFYQVNSLAELDSSFNGTLSIIELFFSNYKGPREMESLGFINKNEAKEVLDLAIEAYED